MPDVLDIDHRTILGATPVRNQAVHAQAKGADELLLFVPLRDRWYMKAPFRWILPLSKERVVNLDRLGTQVWQWCDGQTTVEQIVDRFATTHRMGFHESRLAVSQFLRDLMGRDLIVVIGDASAGESS
jgi:hypothetical protein